MEYQGQLSASELDELHREWVGRFDHPSLPLYGLDGSWFGTRRLGACETAASIDPATEAVLDSDVEYSLEHGHPAGSAAFVRVVSTTDRNHRTLPWRLVCRVEPTPLEGRIAAVDDPDHVPPGARRSEIRLPLDDGQVSFDLLVRGGHFVAAAARANHVIVLEGRGVEPGGLGLVTVRDVRPYVEGTEAARRT